MLADNNTSNIIDAITAGFDIVVAGCKNAELKADTEIARDTGTTVISYG